MLNNKQFQVCIVGAGSIAEQFHLPVIDSNKRSTIASIVDLNEKQGEKISKLYKVPWLKNVSDDTESDICFVATPSHVRKQVILPALDCGMHIVCEKPLAFDDADAQEMINYAEGVGKKIFVAQTRRFFPNLELIRNILKSDMLKKPLTITITEGGAFNWGAVAPDRANVNEKDFGVIHDEGAHIFDMAALFLADLKVDTGKIELSNCLIDKEILPNSCKAELMANTSAGRVAVHVKFSRSLAIDSKVSIEAPGVFIKTRSLYDTSVNVSLDNCPKSKIALLDESNSSGTSLEDAFARQWDSAITELSGMRHDNLTTIEAHSVLPTIKLIDKVTRQAMVEPIDELFLKKDMTWRSHE